MDKIKTRDEIDEKYKWKVDKMYSSDEIWEEDFKAIKEHVSGLLKFKGKLHIGSELLNYLVTYEELLGLYENLMVYAHLKSDEDKSNSKYQVMMDKIATFGAEFSGISSFFLPELLSLEESEVQESINSTEGLKHYEKYIKNIFEGKPHVLSEAEENILAQVSDCLSAPSNIYTMFTNADMTFPKIKNEDGVEVELTDSNYSTFITSKDRRVRKEAFKALFGTYKKFENTISTSYTASVKNNIFESKIRKYESCLEASLKPNKIPVEVYKNVVNTINNRIGSLHKYVDLKKKLLGVNEIHMYDLYVPIIDTPKFNIQFEEGVKLCEAALKPMGEEYISIFSEGVKDGWIDVYPNKGKRGGAYSSGSYTSMPYILLNYNNQVGDVSTLIHEMGHSIHSYYSRKNQSYTYADYVLFCAEVASTTNECLLMDYLIKNEDEKLKRLYLINQQLEGIRTTVFRQTMFAEFELIIHEKMEDGEALSSDDLNSIYHELNVKYFGKTMVVDSEIDIEWARIPHFYRDFYVYQYVTGFAAANSFYNKILTGGEEAVEKYKGFLKAGCSDYPIEILKAAGVDMTTPKPLEDTIDRFDELLEMLEREINK
ncbi:MAG: oligoendopeptidase F [Clostridium sp.]|nr:oligoendopeptidase F [Clostridium sp.]MDU7082282.1 oligoendopeptidase F [Clostridium sp.]